MTPSRADAETCRRLIKEEMDRSEPTSAACASPSASWWWTMTTSRSAWLMLLAVAGSVSPGWADAETRRRCCEEEMDTS